MVFASAYRHAVAVATSHLPRRNRLLLVTDAAGWILDEVARQLSAHLPAALRPAVVGNGGFNARGCTIHFIDRPWARSDGLLDRLHDSNQLVGLWWHGRLDSPEEKIQSALRRVSELHPRFARMQVPCTSAKNTMMAIGVPEAKIVMLPEGVDLTVFRPAPDVRSRRDSRERLGIAGSAIAVGCFQKDGDGWGEGLEPKLIKAPDLLADVLIRLHGRYPIHAVIPGPARGYVKRRLAEKGVPFSATGIVPRRALPPLYHALDLYLSPSRDEGGPAGLLESMASGIPVVATRAGMAEDLIADGVNGHLVAIDDADAMVERAAGLIESAATRDAIRARALETIAAYDWPVLARRYADELYRPLRDACAGHGEKE